MEIGDAIKKSIRAYFMGIEPEKMQAVLDKEPQFTKEKLSKVEKEVFGDTTEWSEYDEE